VYAFDHAATRVLPSVSSTSPWCSTADDASSGLGTSRTVATDAIRYAHLRAVLHHGDVAAHRGQHACRGAGQTHYTVDLVPCSMYVGPA